MGDFNYLMTRYLLSLPERVLRSASALAGGLVREIGNVTVPAAIRRTTTYRTMVEATLRFMIQEVGQVEGVYPKAEDLAKGFLLRKAAGHGLDLAGILAFRASPMWVMAALADLSGTGRHLIHEIAETLKQEGLLARDAKFETIDQMLDGLERGAGQLTNAFNTPPLNVAGLRSEWGALREQVHKMPHPHLPSMTYLEASWDGLLREAAAQERSVFELASVMALSAASRIPANVVWMTSASCWGVQRTGELVAGAILDHYVVTLREIREAGFLSYWTREFRPYLRAAADQFSPRRLSLTERLITRAPAVPSIK
jgi:hypothetical protein